MKRLAEKHHQEELARKQKEKEEADKEALRKYEEE